MSDINYNRVAYGIMVVFAVFSAWYNTTFELHGDEAYYWMWGQHIGWSYYDHPPMIAYLLGLTDSVFGSNVFSVRLVAVLCIVLTGWFIYRLISQTVNVKAACYTTALFFSLPATHLGSMISTPDAPLLMFWAGALWAGYWAIIHHTWRWYLLTAVMLAGAYLSKYTAALLPMTLFVFLFCFAPKRVVSIKPWLAIGVSGVLAASIVIWNVQYDWISLRFQWEHGTGRQGFDQDALLNYLGGVWVMVSPVLILVLLGVGYKAWRLKRRLDIPFKKTVLLPNKQLSQSLENPNRTRSILVFLWLHFALVFSFFLYKGAFKNMELNWYAPLVLSSTALAGIYIQHWRWRVLFVLAIVLNFTLVALVRYPNELGLQGSANLQNRVWGERQAVERLQTLRATHPNDLLCADYYDRASLMAFWLPEQTTIHDPFSGRMSMYDLWNQGFDYRGKNCLLLLDEPIEPHNQAQCQSVSLLLKSNLDHSILDARTFYIYRCEGLKFTRSPLTHD